MITLVRREGPGGAAGYARRLEAGLRGLGLKVAGIGPSPWDPRPVRAEGVVVALERVPGAHVYRAGGGVHLAFRRAMGRWGPSARGRWDAYVARSSGTVIANSRMVADALIHELAVPSSRIEIVRTGVDPAWCPGEAGADGRIVLFAGHGWRRKGALVAARAFAAARAPGDRLWVAGSDSRRRARWAKILTIVPDAVDLGPHADLRRVLPSARVVLHPTRYDPASNLVMEAMACGVPAVTTWMDGSAEVVPEGQLVVRDPTDVRAVASALRFALDAGPSLRAALIEVARRWPDARNTLGVAEIAERYRDA